MPGDERRRSGAARKRSAAGWFRLGLSRRTIRRRAGGKDGPRQDWTGENRPQRQEDQPVKAHGPLPPLPDRNRGPIPFVRRRVKTIRQIKTPAFRGSGRGWGEGEQARRNRGDDPSRQSISRDRRSRSRGLNGSHPGGVGSPIDKGEGVPLSVSNQGGAKACSTSAPTPVFTGFITRASVPAPTCKTHIQVGKERKCNERAEQQDFSPKWT
jgi:hypothetical protein